MKCTATVQQEPLWLLLHSVMGPPHVWVSERDQRGLNKTPVVPLSGCALRWTRALSVVLKKNWRWSLACAGLWDQRSSFKQQGPPKNTADRTNNEEVALRVSPGGNHPSCPPLKMWLKIRRSSQGFDVWLFLLRKRYTCTAVSSCWSSPVTTAEWWCCWSAVLSVTRRGARVVLVSGHHVYKHAQL